MAPSVFGRLVTPRLREFALKMDERSAAIQSEANIFFAAEGLHNIRNFRPSV